MNLRTLKLSIVAAFAAFAAGVFLFSSGQSQAQTGKSNEARDEVLKKVEDYKAWKQVQKPAVKTESNTVRETNLLEISNSTMAG